MYKLSLILLFAISQVQLDALSMHENDSIFSVVEEYPILITGSNEFKYDELNLFIYEQLRYPKTIGCVKGVNYIEIIIEKDGSVSRVKLLRSVEPAYDEEALRVVSLMKAWKPGRIKNETVRTRLRIRIEWKL